MVYFSHQHLVLALRKWGKTDWKPWMLSLAVELTALAGSIRFKQGGSLEYEDEATPVEKQEWKRRKMLLLYYLLRNPAYEIAVRGRVNGVVDFMNRYRILSFFGGILQDYKTIWEENHFNTN
jgi:peroxin-16